MGRAHRAGTRAARERCREARDAYHARGCGGVDEGEEGSRGNARSACEGLRRAYEAAWRWVPVGTVVPVVPVVPWATGRVAAERGRYGGYGGYGGRRAASRRREEVRRSKAKSIAAEREVRSRW